MQLVYKEILGFKARLELEIKVLLESRARQVFKVLQDLPRVLRELLGLLVQQECKDLLDPRAELPAYKDRKELQVRLLALKVIPVSKVFKGQQEFRARQDFRDQQGSREILGFRVKQVFKV